METLNSAMKNQLSFNKMLETQIAQLAASLPNANAGKLPGQPKAPPKEHINVVTTRGGKSTQDPPHPSGAARTNNAGKGQEKANDTKEKDEHETRPETIEEKATPKALPHEFYDTMVLPFPQRNKKAAADEQYSKFVEVIKKLYVNIPLLDAMQIPTYAKYLKDILNTKKPLPSAIIHMTEECSAAILNQPPQAEEKTAPEMLQHEFYDTTVLPFPPRNKRAAADEQYNKFVEVIKKLYVNIPLLDAMQVPTYAKYLKISSTTRSPYHQRKLCT
ncbi:hypothetical protein U9M48_003426 [Paspalum notatum var. saurae]|uniref:Uncharacterized protein n=1 Tax=Paspalum notatum var. saurae TaxID=547442 RepID=A0AAQ3PSQ2_PASNO